VLIHLQEDIWIDTLVLANYEFFSSMIRTFRVSVSDRYPVKMEKWKDLGTYEARNSREIQAFLIDNPQIWARYIRIEFLSHYGNEYYCPLSLVRVHGTRMLESWKETEAGSDDDPEEIGGGEEQYVPEAVAEVVQEEERLQAELKAQLTTPEPEPTLVDISQSEEDAALEETTCLWEKPGFYTFDLLETNLANDICLQSEAPTHTTAEAQPTPSEVIQSKSDSGPVSNPSTASVNVHINSTGPIATPHVSQVNKSSSEASASKDSSSPAAATSNTTHSVTDTPTPSISMITTASKSHNITNSIKNKTTSTSSSASALPTIQESFFKAVSRRLQLLETNSTLSLKYIEEQSKILREAFTKVEKKQFQKTTTFLDTLNSTVLDELRGFRQQYDEIWQSTVISLESQREESRREILAISTRLNILADEVVFQKRMSIVQSILLLLCLGLVIFSRVSGGGNTDFPTFHSRGHSHSHLTSYPNQLESPLDGSPLASPDFQRVDSDRWLETGYRRVHSDDLDTAVSQSRSRDESPPTPISTYSRSDEHALTPSSGVDDLLAAVTEDIVSKPLIQAPLTSRKEKAAPPSRENTPKKRKRKSSIRSIHQEETSPPDTQHPPPLPPRTASISPIADDTTCASSHLPTPPPDLYLQPHTHSPPSPSSLHSPESTPNRNFAITRKPLPSLPEGP
jgi:Sad1 / UNC-like C-terminal